MSCNLKPFTVFNHFFSSARIEFDIGDSLIYGTRFCNCVRCVSLVIVKEIEFAVIVLKVTQQPCVVKADKYFTLLVGFFTVVCTGFG